GVQDSAPTTVAITTARTAPLARAGRNQTVAKGELVQLDGSASSDDTSAPLSYSWSLLSRPNGSNAILSAANTATPQFLADVQGTYVAQLIVSNNVASSTPVTVTADAPAQG